MKASLNCRQNAAFPGRLNFFAVSWVSRIGEYINTPAWRKHLKAFIV